MVREAWMQFKPEFQPRLGALRYWNDQFERWECANPRDPLFSTVTMMATEHYTKDGWKKIYEDGNA